MALAKGESVIRVKELSLHFQTMCHILPMFMKDVQINVVKGSDPKGPYYEVRVKGVGYKPTA